MVLQNVGWTSVPSFFGRTGSPYYSELRIAVEFASMGVQCRNRIEMKGIKNVLPIIPGLILPNVMRGRNYVRNEVLSRPKTFS